MDKIIPILLSGKKLPRKYKDHQLKGKFSKFRELHIQPDGLLIYTKNDTELILTLSRTGSHSELLKLKLSKIQKSAFQSFYYRIL